MSPARVINVVVAGVALLVSLGAGEAALRAVVTLPVRRVLPEVKYAPHPVRRFTLLPDQQAFSYGAPARIDSRGFRMNGGRPGMADERTVVLALGDSFTFGLGVRDHETWPAQLERILAGGGDHPVEVINAGTISYGVFQELDLLRGAGLAERPQLVIHALYWNDFMNASPPKPDAPPVVAANGYLVWDDLTPRSGLSGVAARTLSSSALLFALRQYTVAARDSSGTSYGAAYGRFLQAGLSRDEWEPIERFYGELKQLAAERDFSLVVAVMPVSGLMRNAEPQSHAYPSAAREMLRRLEIPFVDGFGAMDTPAAESDYFLPEGADAHLNPAGYALIADALARTLLTTPALKARIDP